MAMTSLWLRGGLRAGCRRLSLGAARPLRSQRRRRKPAGSRAGDGTSRASICRGRRWIRSIAFRCLILHRCQSNRWGRRRGGARREARCEPVRPLRRRRPTTTHHSLGNESARPRIGLRQQPKTTRQPTRSSRRRASVGAAAAQTPPKGSCHSVRSVAGGMTPKTPPRSHRRGRHRMARRRAACATSARSAASTCAAAQKWAPSWLGSAVALAAQARHHGRALRSSSTG